MEHRRIRVAESNHNKVNIYERVDKKVRSLLIPVLGANIQIASSSRSFVAVK